MVDEDFGFEKERFEDKVDDFQCLICQDISRNPKECTNCGRVFCSKCIDESLQKRSGCPFCNEILTIRPIEAALLRQYKNLKIRCKRCNVVVDMHELNAHENKCDKSKCVNFQLCGKLVDPKFKAEGVCDVKCLLLLKIKESNGDMDIMYKIVKDYATGKDLRISKPSNTKFITACNKYQAGVTNFKWNSQAKGAKIEISDDDTKLFLKEGSYVFRTVLGDKPFTSGVHYWEILVDPQTENEIKLGVSLKNDINLNKGFCDYESGFGLYGLGKLRQGNKDFNGRPYCKDKKFTNIGLVGVFLDMNKGILSFSLNDEYLGIAFKDDSLKNGPIWPAVALIHCAGCKLITGKKAPDFFWD